MPDQWRTDLLLPLVPALVGTRDPLSDSCGITATGLERQRAAALLAWCVNNLEGVTSGNDEAELRVGGAIADAAEALRYGQAQHAARNAAAALAWAVRGITDPEPSKARHPDCSGTAAGRRFALWQGAVVEYRTVAAPPVTASPAGSRALLCVRPSIMDRGKRQLVRRLGRLQRCPNRLADLCPPDRSPPGLTGST